MERFRKVVDNVSAEQWHETISLFADACIHQTPAFGKEKWAADNISHLRLYEGDQIVAAAQVVLITLPILRAGIAHCKFGPMWRLRGETPRIDVYSAALRALREEYSIKRGLMLSIRPFDAGVLGQSLVQQRREAGLHEQQRIPSYHTFLLDTRSSLEELRAGFKPKWRYNLKKAESRGLEIRRSTDVSGADEYLEIYRQMRDIKTFVDMSGVEVLRALMTELPVEFRPTIFTAYSDGEGAASIVVSHIGDAAFYLYGATGPLGRDTGAAYCLFWDALQWLKERDCQVFDLVGSRPQGTGGDVGYRRFKEGLTGRNGAEETQPDWQVSDGIVSRTIVETATLSRWYFRQSLHFFNGLNERIKRQIAAKKR